MSCQKESWLFFPWVINFLLADLSINTVIKNQQNSPISHQHFQKQTCFHSGVKFKWDIFGDFSNMVIKLQPEISPLKSENENTFGRNVSHARDIHQDLF